MIGKPVRRVEDQRFLTGEGRFVDDIEIPGALHCALVRSPHPHARILSIESSAPVLTGRDMAADGIGPMRAGWALPCWTSHSTSTSSRTWWPARASLASGGPERANW